MIPELVAVIKDAMIKAYEEGFASGKSGSFDAPLDVEFKYINLAWNIYDRIKPEIK